MAFKKSEFVDVAVVDTIDEGSDNPTITKITLQDGQPRVNIRRFYTDRRSGELRPTSNGMFLKPEQIDVVIESLRKAKQECVRLYSTAAAA